jgi:hypothetical protein
MVVVKVRGAPRAGLRVPGWYSAPSFGPRRQYAPPGGLTVANVDLTPGRRILLAYQSFQNERAMTGTPATPGDEMDARWTTTGTPRSSAKTNGSELADIIFGFGAEEDCGGGLSSGCWALRGSARGIRTGRIESCKPQSGGRVQIGISWKTRRPYGCRDGAQGALR